MKLPTFVAIVSWIVVAIIMVVLYERAQPPCPPVLTRPTYKPIEPRDERKPQPIHTADF